MKKSKSSHQWLKDHEDDEFVKRARAEGYRSRASYKLLEINEKFELIKRGSCIVDLGAAPGGWSQVAVRFAGASLGPPRLAPTNLEFGQLLAKGCLNATG